MAASGRIVDQRTLVTVLGVFGLVMIGITIVALTIPLRRPATVVLEGGVEEVIRPGVVTDEFVSSWAKAWLISAYNIYPGNYESVMVQAIKKMDPSIRDQAAAWAKERLQSITAMEQSWQSLVEDVTVTERASNSWTLTFRIKVQRYYGGIATDKIGLVTGEMVVETLPSGAASRNPLRIVGFHPDESAL